MSNVATSLVSLTVAMCAVAGVAQAGDAGLSYDYQTRLLRLQGGKAYVPGVDYFSAGDIVRLEITKHPLLSVFQLQINNEKVIQPALPFIRGVSEVEAPSGDAADKAKSPGKGAPLIPGVEEKLAEISKGKTAALRQAVAALRETLDESDKSWRRALPRLHATMSLVESIVNGGPGTDYPGPSPKAVEDFAAVLATEWAPLAQTKPDVCIEEIRFLHEVDRTKLLLQGIRELNARSKALPDADMSGATQSLTERSAILDSLLDASLKILRAARESALLRADADRAMGGPVLPAGSDPVDVFRNRLALGPRPPSAATLTSPELLSVVARIAEEAACSQKDANTERDKWDKLIAALKDQPGKLNDTLANIFASANSVYANHYACDSQELVVKQWNGSYSAEVQIQEVKGFQPFSLAGSEKVAAPSENALKPATVPGVLVTPAGAIAKPGAPAAATPDASAQSKEGGEPLASPKAETVYRFGIEIHQFARANLVAGFARSWLHSREFGLKDIPATGADGQPILDDHGKPVMAKTPVQTKDERGQYVYYVGLEFYLRARDLYPGGRISYAVPALLFAYGVNDAFNFLAGLNWETRWGVNIGVGVHWGRETGLADGQTLGVTQLPSATTAAPTVQRFAASPYINIGFDGSIFKKVFGAAKGVSSSQ